MPKKCGGFRPIILCFLIICGYLISASYLTRWYHKDAAFLPAYFWAEDGLLYFAPPKDTAVSSVRVGSSLNNEGLLYGLIAEDELPWSTNSPPDLNDLRTRYAADLFITAFRTTLPQPILEEQHNVEIAASYIAGKVIAPDEVFSLNRAIGSRTKKRGFGFGPVYQNGTIGSTLGGGICKVASTLYNVAVHSDLPIVERHNHSMLVPYVPPGRDATILWGLKDLRFLNDKGHPLILWAALEDDSLYIALYGQYDPPLVEWIVEELGKTPTWTVRRRNPKLPPGATQTFTGAEGKTVRTWITVEYPHLPPRRKNLGVDYYRPLPTYIEYGS